MSLDVCKKIRNGINGVLNDINGIDLTDKFNEPSRGINKYILGSLDTAMQVIIDGLNWIIDQVNLSINLRIHFINFYIGEFFYIINIYIAALSGSIYAMVMLLLLPVKKPANDYYTKLLEKSPDIVIKKLKLPSQLTTRFVLETALLSVVIIYFVPNIWTFIRRWEYSSLVMMGLVAMIIFVFSSIPTFNTDSYEYYNYFENDIQADVKFDELRNQLKNKVKNI